MVTFTSAAQKQYVLVSLDFPHKDENKAKVPNPKRNDEIKAKYGIGGFPTILLMHPDGEVFGAQVGYEPGSGPDKFLESLAKDRSEGEKPLLAAKEVANAVTNAKPEDKAGAVDKAIAAFTALDHSAMVGLAELAGAVRQAFVIDPENKSGLAEKAAKALMDRRLADESAFAVMQKTDPKNEKGQFEKAVLMRLHFASSAADAKTALTSFDELVAVGGPKDPRATKRFYIMAMLASEQKLKDLERAKGYAKKIREIGIDEKETQVKEAVDRILGPAK
jgi:hypothetical protein